MRSILVVERREYEVMAHLVCRPGPDSARADDHAQEHYDGN
jgi:hypothetical protein